MIGIRSWFRLSNNCGYLDNHELPLEANEMPAVEALLEKPVGLDAIAMAAWHVEDAMLGEDVRCASSETTTSRARYQQYFRIVRPGQHICVALLVVSMFFEMPLWCLSARPSLWLYLAPEDACSPGPNKRLFLSNAPLMPPGVYVLIECVIYTALLCLAALERSWRPQFALQPTQLARTALVIVCFVDAIVFAVVLGCVGAQPFRKGTML